MLIAVVLIAAGIPVGDIAAYGALISLFVLGLSNLYFNIHNRKKVGQVGTHVQSVDTKVEKVQKSLELPSNPDKSIAAELEGIGQSFHFMARLFDEQARDRRQSDEP